MFAFIRFLTGRLVEPSTYAGVAALAAGITAAHAGRWDTAAPEIAGGISAILISEKR